MELRAPSTTKTGTRADTTINAATAADTTTNAATTTDTTTIAADTTTNAATYRHPNLDVRHQRHEHQGRPRRECVGGRT